MIKTGRKCLFLEDFEKWAYSSGSPVFDKMSSYGSTPLDKCQHITALGPRPPQTLVSLSSVTLGIWCSGSGLEQLCLQAPVGQHLQIAPQQTSVCVDALANASWAGSLCDKSGNKAVCSLRARGGSVLLLP